MQNAESPRDFDTVANTGLSYVIPSGFCSEFSAPFAVNIRISGIGCQMSDSSRTRTAGFPVQRFNGLHLCVFLLRFLVAINPCSSEANQIQNDECGVQIPISKGEVRSPKVERPEGRAVNTQPSTTPSSLF